MSDLLQDTIKRNTQLIKGLNIGGLGGMSVKRIAEVLANAEVDTYESDYRVLQQRCEKAEFDNSLADKRIKDLLKCIEEIGKIFVYDEDDRAAYIKELDGYKELCEFFKVNYDR